MRYEPLFDRILIVPISEGSTSKGGLLIPDIAARSRPYAYGDVIAVGFGRTNIEGKTVPLQVKLGDVICYPRKRGVQMPITDDDGTEREVLMLSENEIIAIVHDLARPSLITGLDGQLLKMIPTSRGLPDVVYQNRDDLKQAEKMGFIEPGEFPEDDFEPGDAPDEVTA